MAIGSHTIPRFYLEQFANPAKRKGDSGWVWVFEKGKTPRESSTKAQGYENGHFAFVHYDARRDESFETHLAMLEARCNDAQLCAKSELYDLTSSAHRNELGLYMGLLFARATSRRKFPAGNWAKIQQPFAQLEFNEDYVNDTAAHFSDKTGVEVSPDQIRKMIRMQAAAFTETNVTGNAFVKDLLLCTHWLKSEIVPRARQVLRAPTGVEFVTSDSPVVTFIRVRDDLWNPGHGLRRPGVVVALPLASTACLTVGFGGHDFQEADPGTVRRLNEVVISSCDRFVYSKANSHEIAESTNIIGGWSVPGRTAFVS